MLAFSLALQYKEYKDFTLFDSAFVDASVIKQYVKTKNKRTYQVLKLKSDDGLVFYTTAKKSLQDLTNLHVSLEVWPKELTFYGYMTSFYGNSKIVKIHERDSVKERLLSYIASSHSNKDIAALYQALFLAAPLQPELQRTFSNLGVSHLLAISGFHLGVLGGILFFVLRPILFFFQDRYFPYANSKLILFLSVASVLFAYLAFLDYPPSLLRAFGMFVVGFVLYDRGIEVVSMQTLFVSVVLLLALFPRLAFSVGFLLSASGVFYIFLFFIYFKELRPLLQFGLLGIWVYLMMLPFSLTIFGNFSTLHPFSVVWTMLFILFYPLGILLHVANFGYLLDPALEPFLELGQSKDVVGLSIYILLLHVALSFSAVYKKEALFALLLLSGSIFVYSMYHVTQF